MSAHRRDRVVQYRHHVIKVPSLVVGLDVHQMSESTRDAFAREDFLHSQAPNVDGLL